MGDSSRKDIGAIIRDGTAIDRATELAGYRVVRRHRQLGVPLVIWQDGRVVEVPPESVWIPDDDEAPRDRGNRRAARERPSDRPGKERAASMATKTVKISYHQEGDYLEVIFDRKPGFFRATTSDQVMKKVDREGNVLGFSILNVSAPRSTPIEVTL